MNLPAVHALHMVYHHIHYSELFLGLLAVGALLHDNEHSGTFLRSIAPLETGTLPNFHRLTVNMEATFQTPTFGLASNMRQMTEELLPVVHGTFVVLPYLALSTELFGNEGIHPATSSLEENPQE